MSLTRRQYLQVAASFTLARSALGASFGAQPRRGDPPAAPADFAALGRPINGHPLVYLDSAATTLRPTPVIDAISEFYRHDNANPSPSMHSLARRAADRYSQARTTVARFINAAPD